MYSSTSLRLSSAASLRALRFLQSQRPRATRIATAAIGTTTATAIVPPVPMPLLELDSLLCIDPALVSDDEPALVGVGVLMTVLVMT